MSAYYPLQATFNNGELSPLLGRRDDIDFWRKTLGTCLNFEVMPYGGLRRRSGTRFIAEVADSSQYTRLLPFIFSTTQSYVLALNGAGTVRFHALRGTVLSGASPYSIAHGYAVGDLPNLSYSQTNDVMDLAHKTYAPKKLTRLSETSWTLADSVLKDGPWLPEDSNGTTLKPASYGAATPVMTSNTAPSGTVADSGASAAAYTVFDFVHNDVTLANVPGWVSYTFPSGTKVVDGYYLRCTPTISVTERMCTAWTFDGYDGASWITLDRRRGESAWQAGETRFFDFVNQTGYSAYRLAWESNDTTALEIRISEIGMHERGEDQTPFNLTASSVAGINGGSGFVAGDVGRPIRLFGGDGRWRWARIAAVTSTTVVTIRLYGHALPTLDPISRWQLGAFSATSGYPGAVSLYNERLTYGRTNAEPLSIYGSKQGLFDDFGISDPLLDTDGLKVTMQSSGMNEILWITDDTDIITGSSGQIRSVGPADITNYFSATNIAQRKGPTTGASALRPLSIGGVTLYVGRGATKIRELILGDGGRYVAPELTILGEHVFRSPIIDWTFKENPEPQIIAALTDGTLGVVTYDRDQKIVGVARHDVGGIVESLATIPSETAGLDDVYLVVRRTINGGTKRYIEVLDHAFDYDTSKTVDDAVFSDCSLTYSGSATATITGLAHLEAKPVTVLADGNVVPGLTVSGGSITLPYTASKVHVGLPFTSRAITHPVSGPLQDGSLFGRRVNVTGFKVDVYKSGSVKCGAYIEGQTWPGLTEALHQEGGLMFGNKVELRSGTFDCDIEGSWAEGNGQMVFETSEPLPLLVRAVIPTVESEP